MTFGKSVKKPGQEGNRKAPCVRQAVPRLVREERPPKREDRKWGKRVMGFALRKLWVGRLSVPLRGCVTKGTSLSLSLSLPHRFILRSKCDLCK